MPDISIKNIEGKHNTFYASTFIMVEGIRLPRYLNDNGWRLNGPFYGTKEEVEELVKREGYSHIPHVSDWELRSRLEMEEDIRENFRD